MNPNLFGKSTRGPGADTKNLAGGAAYTKDPKEALANYALVGTLHDTFYATAKFHMETALSLLEKVDDAYAAQVAVYARREGYMKDMPAFIVAYLAAKKSRYFRPAFRKVIDNGKMLRNFVQIIRSGALGRKSFGHGPRNEMRRWFDVRSPYSLMRAVPGQPALADIVAMVRPRGNTDEKDAFYSWLLGRIPGIQGQKRPDARNAHKKGRLPSIVKEYEAYKEGLLSDDAPTLPPPAVDFRLLDFLPLPKSQWEKIARDGKWMFTRMNLNTFKRHGVFDKPEMVKLIADRLRSADEIRKARQFPYQIMTAYKNTTSVPHEIQEALQDAMEIALENVPVIDGQVYVLVDVSGSMQCDVTGKNDWWSRKPTDVRCIDVASLFGVSYLRKNPQTRIVPFDHQVHGLTLNPRDTVFTNAEKLALVNGGATAIGCAMEFVNRNYKKGDVVIAVSDAESWRDFAGRGQAFTHPQYRHQLGAATRFRDEWGKFKAKNPKAKLILHDVQPQKTAQAKTEKDILHVSGFSDQVYRVISAFVNGDLTGDGFVRTISAVDLFSEDKPTGRVPELT